MDDVDACRGLLRVDHVVGEVESVGQPDDRDRPAVCTPCADEVLDRAARRVVALVDHDCELARDGRRLTGAGEHLAAEAVELRGRARLDPRRVGVRDTRAVSGQRDVRKAREEVREAVRDDSRDARELERRRDHDGSVDSFALLCGPRGERIEGPTKRFLSMR